MCFLFLNIRGYDYPPNNFKSMANKVLNGDKTYAWEHQT